MVPVQVANVAVKGVSLPPPGPTLICCSGARPRFVGAFLLGKVLDKDAELLDAYCVFDGDEISLSID